MSISAIIPGLLLAVVASTATDDAIRREVSSVYADGDYQMMPGDPGVVPAVKPRDRSGDWIPRLPGSGADLAGLLRFLAWAILVALIVLGLVWMAREWAPAWPGGPMRNRRRLARRQSAPAAVNVPVAEDARPEFQVHADAERFTEAIHALLLAVLWEVGRRRRRPFETALTSREILSRAELAEEGRDALGGIIHSVEASLFGGAAVGRALYEECVDRYERVLGALATVRA